MDLSSVGKKLVLGQYSSPQEFVADMKLVFENAFSFNKKGSKVGWNHLQGEKCQIHLCVCVCVCVRV